MIKSFYISGLFLDKSSNVKEIGKSKKFIKFRSQSTLSLQREIFKNAFGYANTEINH